MKANPWITKGIAKSSKHRFKLYKSFIKNPSKGNEEKYKTYRNKLNHLIRRRRKTFTIRNLMIPRVI